MNNGKVVSEKEIVGVIESLEDSLIELQKECHILVRLTGQLGDNINSMKNYWNTSASSAFVSDVNRKIDNLVIDEEKMSRFCDSVVVDINYTTVQDETVRGNYNG